MGYDFFSQLNLPMIDNPYGAISENLHFPQYAETLQSASKPQEFLMNWANALKKAWISHISYIQLNKIIVPKGQLGMVGWPDIYFKYF